jgi:hypothetical protein
MVTHFPWWANGSIYILTIGLIYNIYLLNSVSFDCYDGPVAYLRNGLPPVANPLTHGNQGGGFEMLQFGHDQGGAII